VTIVPRKLFSAKKITRIKIF